MQNVLNWLPDSGVAGETSIATGSPLEVYALPNALEATITEPGGADTALALDPLRPVYFAATTEAGPYTVRRGESVDYYAVNLLDQTESAIQPADDLVMGSQKLAAVQGRVAFDRELWRWLLVGGLAILALEWWIYTYRAEY
jgi:hypothetical protein